MSATEPQPSPGTPEAECPIDVALVRALLAQQHPDLQYLPLRPVASGWDNAMFRLGDQLALRLPRRSAAAPLIINEQRWLPQLAQWLPLPVPVPLRSGKPAHGYPWHWSILPWLPGMPADHQPLPAEAAPALAAFLRALHVPAPADAPANPVRGVPLSQRAAGVEARMQRLAGKTNLITSRIDRIWREALHAPLDTAPTWLHGDLHPRNVLVEQGRLSGIIDWGDIAAGDRATDLAAIWMLFAEPQARQAALATYGECSPATLQRARGWALLFAVVLLDTGLADHPIHALIGEQILRRLDEEV